ncbi:hypothetical protein QAC21B_03898 [Acinetobacter bohemicus]|nr:hypothetical protein QAC21B_03898 [Acinetobacter bohemicus]
MKPCSRKPKNSSRLLQVVEVGPVVAKVKGSVKKLGQQYKDATLVLYNKANLQPIAVKKPDENGNYQFFGLNSNLNTFIVAFDQKQKFNAVIQDNVVPK